MVLSAPRNVMIIGLGGTGKTILTFLKQSLIEANNHFLATHAAGGTIDKSYGASLPEVIKILCLDLDSAQKVVVDDTMLDYDIANSEEFAVFEEPLTDIKEYVIRGQIHPAVGPWFERDDAVKLTLPISELDRTGAGQQRQYCRLSFLKNLSNTQNPKRFSQILPLYFEYFRNRMSRNANLENFFIITGSLAGGTGSGCMLDVAQVLKTFIENNNLPNTTIMAISVLSEAFKNTDLSRSPLQWNLVQSNCIAAMREIQRFLVMRDQGYPFLEFKSNNEIYRSLSDKRMPFDVFYLIDGTRPVSGDDLTDKEPKDTMFPAVADYLLTICLNENRPFDPQNTRNIISNTEDGVFASLGLHTWIYPVEDIIKQFSLTLAKEFIEYLRKSHPPTYDIDNEVKYFLQNSNMYYGQNSPVNEYFLGKTISSENFGALDDIISIVEQYERRPDTMPMDVDFFKEVIFAPDKFPKRYIDPKVDVGLIEGNELPTLNLDLSGNNESDEFKTNMHIDQLSEADQVIKLAEDLLAENIGTNNDPVYDKTNPNLKRTYHSILKYYQKLTNEIFGGYQDIKGVYYPGLLENKIMLLLNEVKDSKPLIDFTTNQPIKGQVTGTELIDIKYFTREYSVSLARDFCVRLIDVIQKEKDIVDLGYQTVVCASGQDQAQIAQEEVNRRRDEYQRARVLARFKKNPYLEAMQRLLYNERLVTMKRYYTAVLEDLIAICKGWKETLDNFDADLKNIGSEFEQMLHNLRQTRENKINIRTRTYLSQTGSDFEKALYNKYICSEIRQEQMNGRWVSITNQLDYFNSSAIFSRKKLTDVNSRPGIKRTGRELLAFFEKDDLTPGYVFTSRVALDHAKDKCQSIREESFWEALLNYRDQNKNLRYALASQGSYPTQLVSDVKNYSQIFVNYADQLRSNNVGGIDHTYTAYAKWIASEFDIMGLHNALSSNNFSTRYPANESAGQHFRLTAVRQAFCLTQDALGKYDSICETYRDWLKELPAAAPAVGTPLHNFLGEKHASRYEQKIIENWNKIGLSEAAPHGFFLPLEVIYALENQVAVQDFFWASAYFKLLFQQARGGGFEYAMKKPGTKDGYVSLYNEKKPDLIGAVMKFSMSKEPVVVNLREMLHELRQSKFMEQKNNSWDGFKNKLDGLMNNTLNKLVQRRGTRRLQFIEVLMEQDRKRNAMDMLKEEKMELLFKVFILEEMGRV